MAQTPRCKSSKETNSERSRLNSVASKEYFLMERRRNRVKLIAEGNRYKGVMVGRERDSRDLMEKMAGRRGKTFLEFQHSTVRWRRLKVETLTSKKEKEGHQYGSQREISRRRLRREWEGSRQRRGGFPDVAKAMRETGGARRDASRKKREDRKEQGVGEIGEAIDLIVAFKVPIDIDID
jgi:hypothetical protein